MLNAFKYNIFGTVTVRPGKALLFAVAALVNFESIEKVTSKELSPISGFTEGVLQLLFGADVEPGKEPKIAVFQVGDKSIKQPDLAENKEIQAALREIIGKVQSEIENGPPQPYRRVD
jgi:hypothetical protein